MTVTIRPVPSRVAGNRIVPFGRVQYSYRPNPVGLRDWKPPVPEPLQPAPLLGLGTLALLGLQALAWAWGQLNSRPETFTPDPNLEGFNPNGTAPPPGNTTPAVLWIRATPATLSYAVNNCSTIVSQNYGSANFDTTDVVSYEIITYPSTNCPGRIRLRVARCYRPNGTYIDRNLGANHIYGWVTPDNRWTLSWQSPSAVPYAVPGTGSPLPNGYVVPQVEPEPEPAVSPPAPLPLPLPSTVPQVVPSTEPDALPAPSPLVPVTPGRVAPPIIRPATPVSPQQPKVPAPTATSNGTVIAPAPVPVPTTPEDAIFPVPGGRPVTGRTMTPTIQAVAQEVGRIEQKIDRMLNPDQGQWGDATDRLQLLWQLLSQLYNALTDGAPAGAYELSSPCVVDENGDRIIFETEWPEQGTNHGAILARVDAIAALLQTHKDLKQPNCHIPPVAVGGDFVTVNFEQID